MLGLKLSVIVTSWVILEKPFVHTKPVSPTTKRKPLALSIVMRELNEIASTQYLKQDNTPSTSAVLMPTESTKQG